MTRMIQLQLAVICTLLVSGCRAHHAVQTDLDQAGISLQTALHAPVQQRAGHLLKAAEQFYTAGRLQTTHKLLERLKTASLDPTQHARWNLLRAQVFFASGNLQRSDQRFKEFQISQLPQTLRSVAYALQANISLEWGKLSLALSQYHQAIAETSPHSSARQACIDALWTALLKQPLSALRHARTLQDKQPEAQGWLDLAILAKRSTLHPNALNAALSAWRHQHPNHPAQQQLTSASDQPSIQHISLLLPLSGHLSQAGQAVLTGFTAAYQTLTTPPSIDIIDTDQDESLPSLYAHAIANHADLMIGPLSKPAIETLAQHAQFSLPTLALNAAVDCDRTDGLFQFDLTAKREAQQIADFAFKQGGRRVVILAIDDAWGHNIAQAFSKRWQELGGDVTALTSLDPEHDPTQSIEKTLHIDKSRARMAAWAKQLGRTLSYEVRRRQDFDTLFLAMPAQLAQRVKPLLNFYYTTKLPSYAISSAVGSLTDGQTDPDLDGLIVPDLRWPTDQHNTAQRPLAKLYQALHTAYPKRFDPLQRFYALGVDAAEMITQLSRFQRIQHINLRAASGILHLDHQCLIRAPEFVVLKHQTPVILEPTSP